MSDQKECQKCGAILVFAASIAAPGKGFSYDCLACGTEHWVYGGICEPFENVDQEAIELTIADVI